MRHGLPDSLAPDREEFYVFDLEGRILQADEHACAQLGYEEAELLGMSIREISANQTELGFGKLVRTIRDSGPQMLFGNNRRRDGSTYAVEARLWMAPIEDEERILALLRDASGYQSLIEERDQLISLIENSSEVIAVASADGIYSYMNPAGLELVGVDSVDELVGRPLLELHPESERELLAKEVVPAVLAGQWRGELNYCNQQTGKLTPCFFNSFAVRHSQTGEVIGIAAVAHDITDRKAAERRRERLSRLGDVSRLVATSLLHRDDLNAAVSSILEGVGDVLDVTHAFLCRYRDERTRVKRTHVWAADPANGERALARTDFRDPEPSDAIAWLTAALLKGNIVQVDDTAAESSPVPSTELLSHLRALVVVPVVIHGELESFFVFGDATGPRYFGPEEIALLQIIVESFERAVERQVAERERVAMARDLERAMVREREANRSKSQFLAAISHELRSPMNSIVGYAELLGRANVEDGKREVWLQNLRRSTDFLRSLVGDLLDLSRIESGQMTVDIGPCRLAELIAEVEEPMRMAAEDKGLVLEVVYEGQVPDVIKTDPTRFKQILFNLIGNGIKFTEQGSITLRIFVEYEPDGSAAYLCLAVSDTGPGISEDLLESIFMPFVQAHSRGEALIGVGLGLNISQRLAHLLDGDITLKSDVGSGSTFTFCKALSDSARANLQAPPARPQVVQQRRPASEEVPQLSGLRVLIVDDSSDNRQVLRFLLAESGAECSSAENGALAIKAALDARRAGRPFDVILMDVDMPVMDGLEATRKLREAGDDTPILALTGLSLAGEVELCREAGCNDHIVKPIVPGAFFRTIGRHAGRLVGAEAAGTRVGDEESPFSFASNPRFVHLIERYVGSFPDVIEHLRAARSAGRLEEVRTRVHRLRGTAANYGFPEVTQAAGEAEDAIRAGESAERLDDRLGTLLDHLRRIHGERA